MPRYRPTRPFASLRNLQIYHDLTCAGHSQTKLSALLGMSQRRVSAIARHVRTWVERRLWGDKRFDHPGLRFHYALVQEHARLRQIYTPYLRSLFKCSNDFLESNRDFPRMAELDKAAARELRQYKGLFTKGMDILRSLAELDAMIRRGPFAESFAQQPASNEVDRTSKEEPSRQQLAANRRF
jgi:hypothetical protein